MIKILNFSGRPLINVKRGFEVINFDLSRELGDLSEISLSVLAILKALEKGKSDVLVGNFVIVLPQDPILATGIIVAFMALNKAFQVVAKTREREEGLEIQGFINQTEIANKVAGIREEIWAEYRRRNPSQTLLS